MNKLEAAIEDDDSLLDNLGLNSEKLQNISDKLRKKDIESIKKGYAIYHAAKGNPYKITIDLAGITISRKMQKALAYYFKNPTKDIRFIETRRSTHRVETCPMCGSFGCGTLDHFLPQAKHKIFAIYSMNLVPCCLCNSNKSDTLPGEETGKRFLHPYFDECLSERLIKLQFHHIEEDTITVSSVLLTPETDPNYAAIKFHFERLMKKPLQTYALSRFNQLRRRPGDLIPDLEKNPRDKAQLQRILERELRSKDRHFNSKNNWLSLVLFALLDETLLNWLASKMCVKGRKANAPLVTTKLL